MNIKYSIFLIFAILAVSSCATWRNTLSSGGGIDDAISNSISDFINTSKLFETDSIFALSITEDEDCYIISIGGAVNKIYPNIRDTVGAKNDLFPTNYLIRDGRLFYWNNPEQKITQEMIDVLSQYNAIDLNWRDREYNVPLNIADGEYGENIYIPPMVIDDGKKGLIYYICKNDVTNYKKIGFDTIWRRYKQPKLKCYQKVNLKFK